MVLFSCLHALWQSFLYHPSNRLISWACLCGDTIGHPCRASCLLPPTGSVFLHSTYLQAERPKEGIHGSWSPLAPCEERGIQTASREPFGSVFCFMACLMSYLLILAWLFFFFFAICEGIVKQKIFLSLGG